MQSLREPDGPLHSAESLHRGFRSKDLPADLAVAFFPSEEAAFTAMAALRSATVGGVKLAVSYK